MRNPKKTLALVLSTSMVITNVPINALAADTVTHIHNESCGYSAAALCTHEHNDSCYTVETVCIHKHDDSCYSQVATLEEPVIDENKEESTDSKLICEHVCSEESSCIIKALNCNHEHDEFCGYSEGSLCNYNEESEKNPSVDNNESENKDESNEENSTESNESVNKDETVETDKNSTINGEVVDESKLEMNLTMNSTSIPELVGDVYQIGTAEQLKWFAGLVNGTLQGIEKNLYANAILTTDIVLNENVLNSDGTLNENNASEFEQWTSIGDSINKYSGIFDGNGHTISGIYMINNAEEDENYQGFVGYLDTKGVIKNLAIEDSYLETNYFGNGSWGSLFFESNCGSICGYNKGTIESCVNYGTVLGLEGKRLGGICGYNDGGNITNSSNHGMVQGESYVGGICGRSDSSGTVENCTNEGYITGSVSYIGGICGYSQDANTIDCTNNGKIEAISENSNAGSIGGICGSNASTGSTSYGITNCTNNGSITVECNGSGAFKYIGGICGMSRYKASNINNCVNNGTINAPTQTSMIGGVCGANAGKVSSCYSTGDVTGNNDVGGLCGNNALNNSGTIENCYSTGTVIGNSNVGGFCGNNTYDYRGTIKNCYSTGTVTGSSNVGGFCGNNKLNSSYGTISNCYYYLETEDLPAVSNGNQGSFASIYGKAMEQFNSGEVCYLLNENGGYTDIFWVQNVDQGFETDLDLSPIFKTFMGSDTGSHEVFKTSNEKDYINHIYEHEYSYTVNPENTAQIVQDCSNHKTTNCESIHGTATITSKPEYIYDGQVHGADVEYSENWFDKNLTILYVQGETALESEPIDAGDYLASITKYNATATIAFKIIPVETSVTITPDKSTLTGGGTVKLTVDKSKIPEGAKVTVSCNQPNITITDNGDGTYTVNLPNSTTNYEFTVDYAGNNNYMPSDDKCTVQVKRRTSGGSSGGGSSSGGGTNIEDEDVPLAPIPEILNGTDHFAYIFGYEDSTIRPENYITRAETAAIFYRLLDDSVRDSVTNQKNKFTDINESAWYAESVKVLTELDIIKGVTETTFEPNRPITRAEFAAIAARFDFAPYFGEDMFTDISGHWAKDEINSAAQNGWVNGNPDGTYKPNNNITRAEAVTLINNVLHRLPENEDALLDDMIRWPDNTEGRWYYLAMQEASNSHTYEYTEDGIHEIWTGIIEN